MTPKLILATAVAAFALTGGSLALSGTAFAKDGGGHGGGGGGGGAMHMMRMSTESHRDHGPDRDVHREVIRRDFHEHDHDQSENHDRSYADRHHDHDRSRHFWHERWWDYGSGPCWRWSDEYDEYVWMCE